MHDKYHNRGDKKKTAGCYKKIRDVITEKKK